MYIIICISIRYTHFCKSTDLDFNPQPKGSIMSLPVPSILSMVSILPKL